MHNGFVRVDNEKMSKSLGNYIGINEPAIDMVTKTMKIGDALMWRWIELLSFDIGIEQAPVSAVQLAQVIVRIADGTVSNNAARQLFEELWKAGSAETPTAESLDALIDRLGHERARQVGLVVGMGEDGQDRAEIA